MTVEELIKLLEKYPKETRVYIGKNKEDDRWNYDYTEEELEEKDIHKTGVYHWDCIVIW